MAEGGKMSDAQGMGCVILILIVGGFWLRGAMCGSSEARNGADNSSQTQSAEDLKREAEINSEPKRGPKPIPSEWDGITPEANAYLKATLKDAESLKLVECSVVIRWKDDRWAQRVKYRAKNSFGAYALEESIFVIRDGKVTGVVEN